MTTRFLHEVHIEFFNESTWRISNAKIAKIMIIKAEHYLFHSAERDQNHILDLLILLSIE